MKTRTAIFIWLITALSSGAASAFSTDASVLSRSFNQTTARTNSAIVVTATYTNGGTAAVRGFWYSEQIPTALTLTPLSVTVNGQNVTNYVFETGQDGDVYPGCTPRRWILETPLAFAQNHPLATNAGVQVTYSLTSSNAGAFALAQFSWCGRHTNDTNAPFGYSETNDAQTLTFAPYALTVTADSRSKAYGTTDPALTFQVTSGSLVGTDSFSGSLARLSGENAGSYAIQQGTLTAGVNYKLTFVPASLTITSAPLTVTADAKTKVYGTADPALTAQITSGALVGGDSLGGNLARLPGENAASYAILQGTLSAGANYALTFVPANLTITPAPLTASADAKTKVYGTADPALTARITSGALVGGDSLGGNLARLPGENAGSYGILQGTLSAGGNYALAFAPANLIITPAPLTVSADAKTKVYGTADPPLTSQITSGALVGGDNFGGSLARLPGENAGAYAIQLGTLGAGGNYALTFVTANLTITPAALFGTVAAESRAYGATNPAFSASYSGFVAPDNENVLNGTLGFQCLDTNLAGVTTNTPVGSYPIHVTAQMSAPNYQVSYADGSLTITQAVLTVTADPQSRIYGATNPVLTFSYHGFVNGEGAGALGGAAAAATVAQPGSAVGEYAVTLSDGTVTNLNYNLSFVAGTLTITPAPLTVTADAESKAYGTADPPLTWQFTGGSLVDGDSLTGILIRAAGENAASYAILQGTLSAGGNYALTFTPASLTITPAPLTVSADAKTKVYGTSDPPLTSQITGGGLVGGDSLNGSLARVPGENAGAYAIQLGTLGAGGNYALTFVPANLTITPAALTGTVAAESRAYGATNPAFSAGYTGFVAPDNESVLTGTLGFQCLDTNLASVTTNTPVGIYPIHVTVQMSASNYQVSYADGSLTITQAVLTVTADPQSRIYGATNPVLTFSYSGFVNGEGRGQASWCGLVVAATDAQLGSAVGDYAVTLISGTVTNLNYNLNFVPGTLTVTPAPLTITADSKSKIYGTADPALTWQITGGALASGDSLKRRSEPRIRGECGRLRHPAGKPGCGRQLCAHFCVRPPDHCRSRATTRGQPHHGGHLLRLQLPVGIERDLCGRIQGVRQRSGVAHLRHFYRHRFSPHRDRPRSLQPELAFTVHSSPVRAITAHRIPYFHGTIKPG